MTHDQPFWTMEMAVVCCLGVAVFWLLCFRRAVAFTYWKIAGTIRDLPKTWRYLTDPSCRRRHDIVAMYGLALRQLLADRALVRHKELSADLRPKGAVAAAEEFEESKRLFTALFRVMDDEALEAVAHYAHEDILKQGVPLAEVLDFFRDEKSVLAGMPCMAVGHLDRFLERFGKKGAR